METAVINVRTSRTVKVQAQRVAQQLGFTLSALINAYLQQLTKTKTVHFTLIDEIPNNELQAILKQAEFDRREGKVKRFTNTQAALDHLDEIVA